MWDGNHVTLYETSQGVVNHRVVMAQVLGIPIENVRVVTRFLGSGFGGKLFPWPHTAMAAVAAQQARSPRQAQPRSAHDVFDRRLSAAHRAAHASLGATKEGKLLALRHDYLNITSQLDEFNEGCGEATPYLYSVANLEITGGMVRRNVGAPMYMRGPGAVPGLYAPRGGNERTGRRAQDRPAAAAPAQRRRKGRKQQTSLSHRGTCASASKTARRSLAGRGALRASAPCAAMARFSAGDWPAQAGWRCAFPARQSVEFCANGRLCVRCGTQDIGTGTYTIFAQVLHEKTGVPLDRIDVILGDSALPDGPMSGGSMVTGSVLNAIAAGADNAIKRLQQLAACTAGSPVARCRAGRRSPSPPAASTRRTSRPAPARISPICCKLARLNGISAEGKTQPSWEDPKAKGVSLHSYGAQFVEVEWEPEIARLRVSRVVTVIDAGRIINPRAAANQIAGAVVMGVGMGLLEETIYDQRSGQPINGSMADYLMATCADAPEIDVTFLDYPDPAMGEYGARGVGEIGLAGVAAAITAAVYHATGVRVRELPVRIENLLQSQIVEREA